jgi:hypothetical protein
MSVDAKGRLERLSLRRAMALVALASVATAILIVALLWVQMTNGRDPALGPKLAKVRQGSGPTVPRSRARTVVIPLVSSDDGEEGGQVLVPVPAQPPSQAPAPAPAPVQTTTS